MTDTQRFEKPDYFGQTWNNTSPTRPSTARSPGPQRFPDYGRQQIRPGANNSFNTHGSPIRGLRNVSRPATSGEASSRPRRGPSQDGIERVSERVTSPTGSLQEHNPNSGRSGEERQRRKRAPSQKAMLSEALSKANHAVQLDNAQNFEGAMVAYHDACDLLQQVMARSSGGDDRRKLEAIRNTYRNRIKELVTNELAVPLSREKALPDVPMNSNADTLSNAGQADQYVQPSDEEEEPVVEQATTLTMEREVEAEPISASHTFSSNNPFRINGISSWTEQQALPQVEFQTSSSPIFGEPLKQPWVYEMDATSAPPTSLAAPMANDLMPRPLSPKPPTSPQPQELTPQSFSSTEPDMSEGLHQDSGTAELTDKPTSSTDTKPKSSGHQRLATMESTSWLDTIEESAGSSNSSLHSRLSSIRMGAKQHQRNVSGDTEAEFDAALDAAVEAAYDDEYELVTDEEEYEPLSTLDTVLKNVGIARQRVKDAEREDEIFAARQKARQRFLDQAETPSKPYEDAEHEEEERMLDNMTRSYVLEQQDINGPSKTIPPRQSDSSGFSGRTLGSSVGSTLTAGTNLSTVAENSMVPGSSNQTRVPMGPPPASALPAPPNRKSTEFLPALRFTPGASPRASASGLSTPGVRERRLSGQKIRQLTIDTAVKPPPSMAAPLTQPMLDLPPLTPSAQQLEPPRSATLAMEVTEESEDNTLQPSSGLPDSARPFNSHSPAYMMRDLENEDQPPPASPVKSKPTLNGLRKNFSASSLRSLSRHGSGTPATDDTPGTPMTRMFSASSFTTRVETPPVMPDLPTPGIATFVKGGVTGVGLSFLDNDIHSPKTPGSPSATATNPPVPLEPCPESFLLRPFWLMRAVYQTIAHPRGGYISTRLFIPRDTWRVVNVKLKNIEDKVANCDLLTAALMNLSKVDTLDADAVLEEMQSFELILDQVQAQWNKKLGAEVGLSGSATLFKTSSNPSEETALVDSTSRNANISGKSYLSWKRLRSKNSMGPSPTVPNSAGSKSDSKDFLTMRTLPMTTVQAARFAKRDPTKVLGIGPHSHYMASLGRLCDAVQILDQIARQVEDPGLSRSSQTHVGLELCIRHAAEFFAFYVCRFALSDIGMMLDKFVKRGSEWVLA